jgi:hypothetical protein
MRIPSFNTIDDLPPIPPDIRDLINFAWHEAQERTKCDIRIIQRLELPKLFREAERIILEARSKNALVITQRNAARQFFLDCAEQQEGIEARVRIHYYNSAAFPHTIRLNEELQTHVRSIQKTDITLPKAEPFAGELSSTHVKNPHRRKAKIDWGLIGLLGFLALLLLQALSGSEGLESFEVPDWDEVFRY